VWSDLAKGQYAIVVAGNSPNTAKYTWKFSNKNVKRVLLYEPIKKTMTIYQDKPLSIKGIGLQIIVEKMD
jgi:hypothetical protein